MEYTHTIYSEKNEIHMPVEKYVKYVYCKSCRIYDYCTEIIFYMIKWFLFYCVIIMFQGILYYFLYFAFIRSSLQIKLFELWQEKQELKVGDKYKSDMRQSVRVARDHTFVHLLFGSTSNSILLYSCFQSKPCTYI